MFKKLERKSVFSVAVIMFALVFVSIKHVSGGGGGGGSFFESPLKADTGKYGHLGMFP